MSFWGAITGSDGIKKAAKLQKQAAAEAQAFTREGLAKSDALLQPAANYGAAQDRLFSLNGLNGAQAQEDAYGAFRESPGVAFMRKQGEEAAQRGAAAGGGLASGRTLADLNTFGQGVAEQDFGNQYDRLFNLYGTGVNAAGTLAGYHTGAADRLGNIGMDSAQKRGQLAIQKGQIIPDLISQGLKIFGKVAGGFSPVPMGSASIY